MSLVEHLPHHYKVFSNAPVRLSGADLKVPENIELTYVGVAHDARYSTLDFLASMLRDNHILAYEINEWTPQTRTEYNRLANGYPKAKQELEKGIARQRIVEETAAHRQADWDQIVLDAIYESGVRVILPDYPKGHPAIAKTDKSLMKVDRAFARGEGFSEEDKQIWAAREIFIAKALCDGIHELRRHDKKKTALFNPLKVLMLFGTTHMAVPDLLLEKAVNQGVSSFHVRKLFEDNAVDPNTAHIQVEFQNWLRTPKVSTQA